MKQSIGKRADQISRQLFGRPVGQVAPRTGPITVTPQKTQPLDREALPHFWHPDRFGVEHPPDEWRQKLSAVHEDLRLTRAPARAPVSVRCWQLWMKKGSITHALCPGWSLLMLWQFNNEPLPLDERLFAAIYHFDARHMGDAVKYFDRIISERDKARELREKRYKQSLYDEGREFRQSTKISNLGSGSKFALHHDGTIIPSRGEVNWNAERRRSTLPSKILNEEKDR
jgi:hypothetical protein